MKPNKNNPNKITKDMVMGEIIVSYPQIAQILIGEYDLHCVGCSMASFETLEEGFFSHGYSPKQITQIIKKLNDSLAKS